MVSIVRKQHCRNSFTQVEICLKNNIYCGLILRCCVCLEVSYSACQSHPCYGFVVKKDMQPSSKPYDAFLTCEIAAIHQID